jgi:hypothetical protein
MADKKISELVSITGSATAADDYFVVVDTSGAVTYKISREELNNAIEQDVLSSIEITDITNDVNVQGTVTADGLTVDGKATIDQGALGGNTLSLDRTGADGTLGLFNNGTQTGLISAVSGGGINAYVGSTPSLAMSISSTGNVGIGVGSTTNKLVLPNAAYFAMQDTGGAESLAIRANSSDAMEFLTGGGVKATIGSSGNVAIGSSSVAHKLTVNASAFDGIQLQSNGSDCGYLGVFTDTVYVGAGNNLVFHTGNSGLTNGTERLRIKSNGQIYAAAESQSIATFGARKSGAAIEFGHANNGGGYYGTLGSYGGGGQPYIGFSADAEDSLNTFTTRGFKGNLIFGGSDGSLSFSQLTNASATGQTPTLRMLILPSGDVAIGNTVANVVSAYSNQPGGGYIRTDSHWEFGTTSNRAAVEIGKNNANDGQLVALRKQGATIGSIDAIGGKLTINSQGSNLSYATGSVVRMNNDASQFYVNTDNSMNLGIGHLRWNTLFASNGTINTSDTNEKQQIAALTEAEMTAAKAISQLFKTFKWNDSVAEKGDAARTHTGVIAQDVQAAMSAAGLNAANYAFWCSDTWWETQTEVPAVEADEENGIEAVAAYTRTDTFKTVEEAPEGAAERTRLGIRYPELLAFIGAATEQRLSNIETRLAALETN